MSSSIQALRERLATASKAANHILNEKGDSVWSVEDQAKFDNHVSEAERIKSQISAHEKIIANDADINFSYVEDNKININAKNGKVLSENEKIFNTYLRKSFKEMTVDEARAVQNTMSTTTAAQGGNTVQSEVASILVDYLKDYGYMRRVASQLTTSSGAPLAFPTSDGTSETGEWIAQNVTATGLDPSFGSVALNVFKASSKVVAVPFELLQDSQIDIQAMLFKRLANRIGRISNTGFTTGEVQLCQWA